VSEEKKDFWSMLERHERELDRIFTSGPIEFSLEIDPVTQGTWIDVMTLPGESKEHAFAKLAAQDAIRTAEEDAARAAREAEEGLCP
jgi:hypothetical protein